MQGESSCRGLMEPTEAEARRTPQGGRAKGRKQTLGRRNTNEQRGRKSRVSVLATAKPKTIDTTFCRVRRREWKDRLLTQGGPLAERLGGVSRGHSSDEAPRKRGGAKGRRTMEQSSMSSWRSRLQSHEKQRAATTAVTSPSWQSRAHPLEAGQAWRAAWRRRSSAQLTTESNVRRTDGTSGH
jgi:hypothetical protein